uniref:Uncharacterized protein n=1 Tax=Knipowitschia caucasica TaxID=637954 RepID=A0AAV2J2G1_KNICA
MLQSESLTQQKHIKELEDRIEEQERYHRQWSLCLYRLPEREGEDLKKIVIDICRAIAPETESVLLLFVDICHRLGWRMEGTTRPVMIRFISRAIKKTFLKTKKFYFKEDLSAKNKEICKCLLLTVNLFSDEQMTYRWPFTIVISR